MRVLLFGASSQIGHFLLPRLLARHIEVWALSRQARLDQPGVHWLRGALPDTGPDWPDGFAFIPDALLSMGPLDALATWLERIPLGVAAGMHIVATSSMSAVSKQDSPDPQERAMAARLCAAEQRLAVCCQRQGWSWFVLRPTLIYGSGMDHSLTPIARRAMRWRVFPLPNGRGLRQPVHADDLARALLTALERPASGGRVLAFGGGERLTAAAMFARVRDSLPVFTVALPVPLVVMRLTALGQPRWRGPIGRLQQNLIADNEESVRLLGVEPRGFAPDAAAFGLSLDGP